MNCFHHQRQRYAGHRFVLEPYGLANVWWAFAALLNAGAGCRMRSSHRLILGVLVLTEYLYYLAPRPHNLSRVGAERNTGTALLGRFLDAQYQDSQSWDRATSDT
jgi:hypothetical protein